MRLHALPPNLRTFARIFLLLMKDDRGSSAIGARLETWLLGRFLRLPPTHEPAGGKPGPSGASHYPLGPSEFLHRDVLEKTKQFSY